MISGQHSMSFEKHYFVVCPVNEQQALIHYIIYQDTNLILHNLSIEMNFAIKYYANFIQLKIDDALKSAACFALSINSF